MARDRTRTKRKVSKNIAAGVLFSTRLYEEARD